MNASDSGANAGCNTPMHVALPTVEEHFNAAIKDARQYLEDLCIKKAKLETLNLHKVPFQEVRRLFETYPF